MLQENTNGTEARLPMDDDTVDEILSEYGLTRETAQRYIDGVVRLNRSQTADELDMSGDTIHRYKRAFNEMSDVERAAVINALAHDTLLDYISVDD